MRPQDEDDPEDDAGQYEPEDPETYPDGLYADDDLSVAPCPHCRREVAEDVAACPYCGQYLSAEDAPREPKSMFWLVMMLLALAAVVFMALAG